MKKIPLTQGKVALVDDADFDRVNQFKWYALKNTTGNVWYAMRTSWDPASKKRSAIYLHTFLTGFDRTDHQDGDGLNCQRENLRPATSAQNMQAKQTKRKNTSSRFRGVSWHKAYRQWQAQIKIAGKLIYLGRYVKEQSAAKAYDVAAKKYFGKFASPNFTN